MWGTSYGCAPPDGASIVVGDTRDAVRFLGKT